MDPGFSKRGGTQAYGKNICARENFFYPALANQLTCKLSCITVILISGHTKKGGGHVPEMPTPRSTTGIIMRVFTMKYKTWDINTHLN